MRGKGITAGFLALLGRITPAYAGKRLAEAPGNSAGQDHPRVCGEKAHTNAIQGASQGSPPRMRGKEKLTTPEHTPTGITPAYAGKRLAYYKGCADNGDHPRVCGEKTKKIP